MSETAGSAGPGIIPAYAGSTPDWRGSIQREKDHPRIRGEHLRFRRVVLELVRIIPAYAGSTPPLFWPSFR